jgi:gas vesicle protein
MGMGNDAKETAEAVGDKIQDTLEDTADRIGDQVDEWKADSNVKKAEAERDSVKTRNEIKEDLRDDKD